MEPTGLYVGCTVPSVYSPGPWVLPPCRGSMPGASAHLGDRAP